MPEACAWRRVAETSATDSATTTAAGPPPGSNPDRSSRWAARTAGSVVQPARAGGADRVGLFIALLPDRPPDAAQGTAERRRRVDAGRARRAPVRGARQISAGRRAGPGTDAGAPGLSRSDSRWR
ncbi:hypothetical protein GCM10023175_27840 [Pseudonocardia xishanensis]|uniref:Uncharacterized protein n=1 Tax=Pseudonocardia xishanensis TaxID=630995 RepID=A0ABP8RT36_9PSEU